MYCTSNCVSTIDLLISTYPYHCWLLLLVLPLLYISPYITHPHSMVPSLCQSPGKPLFLGACFIPGGLGSFLLSIMWLGNLIRSSFPIESGIWIVTPGSLAP